MIKRVVFEERWLPYLLIGPQLLIIFLFFYWPTGQALFWSFTLEPPFGGDAVWVGLRNIAEIAVSPVYHSAIRNTLIMSVSTTVIALGLGLIFAVFADRGLRGTIIYKTAIMWPYAVAAPVAAVAWQYIFQPQIGFMGIVNQWYPGFWNPSLNGGDALIMVIVASSWTSITFNFVFFLAGLQAIPNSLVEAAAMDGAGPVRRFFDLVFPLISPTFFLLLVLNVTTSFTEGFGIINVMTQGGPGNATQTMVYKIYKDGFVGLDLSSSSAQSLILMALVISVTLLQFRFVERKVHYAGSDKGEASE
ncbi:MULTISPECIES: ABC transporter permease subunit [unclassified Rhizobium]|jgi:sn-glycerol 3-phosphate transport system permease protein|uniref:ABC transporter permease subunit n=1 Tax=unclassified Rhizobium TaxID=2613769 RepID=UPI0018F34586|nr:ABC transporter permease subunit [Rhizobium sp. BG4]QRM44400.1 ABC transporter permease subunit [Rhizobium sp. BG4]